MPAITRIERREIIFREVHIITSDYLLRHDFPGPSVDAADLIVVGITYVNTFNWLFAP